LLSVSTYLIRLLNNTIFNHSAVTDCALVVATRDGKLLNSATATNAVLSTDIKDLGVLRTTDVVVIPGSISPPIDPYESAWTLSTPIS
jgi:hypothetical protein